jgi:hypothetical protein
MNGWTNTVNLNECYPSIGGMHWFGNEGEIEKLTNKVNLCPVGNIRSIEEAYLRYPPLAAIILRISGMFANGLFEVLNRTTQNYTRGQYKEWDKLFAKPNKEQTRSEFLRLLNAYTLLNGWCYVQPKYISGFDVPSELWILPPWQIEIEPVYGAAYDTPKKRRVFYCNNGSRTELDETKLILYKDSGALLVNKLTLLPISRVSGLELPISNGIGAYESRNTLIYRRGAIGILSNTSNDVHGIEPIEEDEKSEIQRKFNYQYGLTRRTTDSVIVTDAALKWQSMIQSVKELMLHEEHLGCIKDICDIFGYNYRLLSTGEGASYANASEDEKRCYYDTIIPMSESIMETTNNGLNTIDKNIEIKQSYDHVYVFQESKEEQGKGINAINTGWLILWDNGLVTRNQWLEELDIETVANPLFDKYKFELTPEQLGIIQTDINPPDTSNSNN